MQVLQYLLDDVSEFLSTKFVAVEGDAKVAAEGKGCLNVLKAFIEFISERERENFRSRRHDNEKSITLTTIHQVFFSDIQLNLLGLFCCCSGGFFWQYSYAQSCFNASLLPFAVKRLRMGCCFHS